jgi:hypothetical protein
LFVTPDEIEDAGYTVVSGRYLAQLEHIAAETFAFLESEVDKEALRNSLLR